MDNVASIIANLLPTMFLISFIHPIRIEIAFPSHSYFLRWCLIFMPENDFIKL